MSKKSTESAGGVLLDKRKSFPVLLGLGASAFGAGSKSIEDMIKEARRENRADEEVQNVAKFTFNLMKFSGLVQRSFNSEYDEKSILSDFDDKLRREAYAHLRILLTVAWEVYGSISLDLPDSMDKVVDKAMKYLPYSALKYSKVLQFNAAFEELSKPEFSEVAKAWIIYLNSFLKKRHKNLPKMDENGKEITRVMKA